MKLPKAFGSLKSWLLTILGIWLLVSLIITGVIISKSFRNIAESNFDRLLLAHAYNIIAVLEVDDGGQISGAPDLGEPEFLTPSSGWYWIVSDAAEPSRPLIYSPGISGEEFSAPNVAEVPFGVDFRRYYRLTDNAGFEVRRLELQVSLGEGDTVHQILVSGNLENLNESLNDFGELWVALYLLLGAGTLIVMWMAVRFGLRPINNAQEELVEIREGEREQLDGNYPTEIEPLAAEINQLIEANKMVTDRARTQVGNLAHGLKTPLAVIHNETNKPSAESLGLISQQAGLMQSQIDNYLARARIAAQNNIISSRTEVTPVVERLLRVMEKLNPNVSFAQSEQNSNFLFKGEQQDLEELLGNLLENAGRFAHSRVLMTITTTTLNFRPMMCVCIDDDGPGLNEDDRKKAMKRGQRLDESEPGSGLGLSIVRDIALEYGGQFELRSSELGGLRAEVTLPTVKSANL